MKKDYEKPVLEVVVYEISVSASVSDESELDIGGWWDLWKTILKCF